MPGSSKISKRRKNALQDGGIEYAAKRVEIVDIAAHLFREKGYQATRFADIAAEAGIDRATLYYYVGSKEELFRDAITGAVAANIEKIQRIRADESLSHAERLQRIMGLLMASYETNFPSMYVYIQELMHQVAREESPWAKDIMDKTRQFESVVESLIRSGIAAGEFNPDIPVKLVANALFGMFNWTHRWFTPKGTYSGADVTRAFCEIFFKGLNLPQA
jgi:AcrR family transcriptional regulator